MNPTTVADAVGPQENSTPPAITAPARHGRGIAVGLIGGLAILLLLVLLPAVLPGGAASLPARPTGIGAPDFSLRDLNASTLLRLSAQRGHPVVVNFWASWCTPCQEEARTLADGERRWRDRGVIFIGVNAQDTTAAAREFIAANRIEYRNLVDTTSDVLRSYGVTGFPETFFIDGSGVVRAKEIVALDPALLDRSIATTL